MYGVRSITSGPVPGAGEHDYPAALVGVFALSSSAYSAYSPSRPSGQVPPIVTLPGKWQPAGRRVTLQPSFGYSATELNRLLVIPSQKDPLVGWGVRSRAVRRASRFPGSVIDVWARRCGFVRHQSPEHLGGTERPRSNRRRAGRAFRGGPHRRGGQAGEGRLGRLVSGLADQVVGSAAGSGMSVRLSRRLRRYNQRLHLTVAARLMVHSARAEPLAVPSALRRRSSAP